MVLSYGAACRPPCRRRCGPRPRRARTISGTEGDIWVEGSFYAPTSFRVQRLDGRVWAFDKPGRKGLQYEAAEVARCVAAGATQSPRMTWDNTLEVMRTMDTVRSLIGRRRTRGSDPAPCRGSACPTRRLP